ncbi:ABC transporter permease [Phytoactinopolyspora mesophila]|uniref:ABC transporter permease subunit n=1 Tax=Phytoactinopolyspora mesophila TaxID=2650750 RepID=A0A7K3M8I2_9ACTN|nr:ABC transporter permease [Phytoactinopolyspora mesophila]NDL58728.1 ABC transporter permease subunit [Phytoactinopolyspora mesophila]
MRPLPRRRHVPGWLPLAVPGGLAVTIALAGPFVVDDDATTSRGRPFLSPERGLPLGTDHLGRDVWSVLLDSGVTLVALPLLATLFGTAAGTAFGMLTGWYGGRLSAMGLRISELMLVVPPLLIAVLAFNAVSGSGIAAIVAVIAVLGVPATMRFTRAATSTVVARGYIDHAVALGTRGPAILVREVLPTIIAPVLADAGLRLVGALYLIASVGFLGLGGAVLESSWAGMVADNVVGVPLNPWAMVAPAVCLVALAVSVNLLADRLADTYRGSLR